MKSNNCLFVGVFSCLISSLSAATFPQLALGGGYECIVIVSNKTNFDWDGTVSLLEGNAEPWSAPWTLDGMPLSPANQFNVSLPPKGTKKFVLGGEGEARAGYLEIDGELRSSIFDITVTFFYNFSVDGQLVDSTGAPEGEWDTEFVLPVEKAPGINTGFAWSPSFSTSPFDIVLTLFDQDGNQVGIETITFTGHFSKFFDEIFKNLGDSFLGSLLLESEGFIYLTALRLELTENGFQLTGVRPDDLIF